MYKKFRITGRLDKHHGKLAQAWFKSASHRLYHIHRSLSSQLS